MNDILRRPSHAEPVPPSLDPFAEQVAQAQQALDEAIDKAGLHRDPYRHVMEAWSAMAGLLPPLVQRIEASRQPVRDQELRQAVIAGVRACASDIIRQNSLRTWIVGAAVGIAWTIAVGAAVWWWGRDHLHGKIAGIERSLTGPEAAAWRTLIENNDLSSAVAAARKSGTCGPQDGRTACVVPLWMGPLPPPATMPPKS